MDRERELELTNSAKNGDERAFEELVREYQRKLYSFIYRLCENHDVAGEVTQKSFVKAYFSLESFRGEALFSTWLYKIALNTFRNHVRDEGKRKHLSIDGFDPSDEEKILSIMIKSEEKALVAEAVKTLPDRQREALVLRINEGHPFSEVSRIMGCSLGAAKASYHQAVKKLKVYVEKVGS